MPYKWGGFDTPASFARKIRRGYFAGDIATADKKRLLEAAVSRRATGVDCSGRRCAPDGATTGAAFVLCDCSENFLANTPNRSMMLLACDEKRRKRALFYFR